MAFIASPNIIECQLRGTMDGQRVMNRINVRVGGTPTAGDCTTVASNLATWWNGNVKALIPASVTIREIYCKSMAVQNGPEATYSAGYPLAGTWATGGAAPNNVSLCASLRTGLTGRSARGRWYWYGVPNDKITLSAIDAGYVASVVGALDNLNTLLTSLSAAWVIVSHFNSGIPRVGGPVYFNVVDILCVDNTVDSQRRRLPGRGA